MAVARAQPSFSPSGSRGPRSSPGDLGRLFNPRSIALIGATDRSAWSWGAFGNLAPDRYDGHVYLVNPRGGVVHDATALSSIAELPDGVDLAYIMVGTGAILEVIAQVAARGIPSAVILTAGFSETGGDGAQLERAVKAVATRHGMTLLGPNGNGFVNVSDRVAPYGLPIDVTPRVGTIGVVLQSGGLASAVMDLAIARNVGLRLLTATGNELTTTMTDIVRYLVGDEATKVIALFIESIRDPEEFRTVAADAFASGKPIIAMKVGRSDAGARVAKAHTGSLVGDDAVIDAVFAQLGIIRVDSLEELIVTAEMLASGPVLTGPRFGLVSTSGGANEIIADRGEAVGLEFPEFSSATEDALREMLPPFASPHNPVDVTGLSFVEKHMEERVAAIVAADPNIDAVLFWCPLLRHRPEDRQAYESAVDYFRSQVQTFAAAPKPVVVLDTAFTDITSYAEELARVSGGYPNGLGGMYHGVAAIGHAIRWYELQRMRRTTPIPARELPPLAVDALPGSSFGEYRASELLRAQGVPVVPVELVHTADAALAAAERFGYPVVVKLAADEVQHKSDVGGVKLHLASADAVRQAFDDVTVAGRGVGAMSPAALVQPQRSGGVELIVGVVRDPDWGLVLAVGLGGIWVEVFKDSVLHPLPCDPARVRKGLDELRAASLLRGVRGSEPADFDAITRAVLAVADVAIRLGDRLESLEVNPLLVRGSSVEALDALITWSPR